MATSCNAEQRVYIGGVIRMAFWVQLAFWMSVLAIFHTYIIYPCFIVGLAYWATRRDTHSRNNPHSLTVSSNSHGNLPAITVLISAYNAAVHIERRIKNLLSCHYPADKLQIVIASDGSSDDTVKNALSVSADNVSVLDFRERRGKAATLVRALSEINTGVILFTDVSTQFAPSAITCLARHFEAPAVGIVTGKVLMRDDSGSNCEGAYWKYESAVRRAEARLGVLTGVSGAIYAIRRDLFVPPERPTINDDMVFPILAKSRHGCKFVLDEEAIAEVVVSKDMQHEFARRRRIGLGAFQSILTLLPSMSPRFGLSAFALLSHKVLRWLGPFAIIIAFLSNILLLANPLYQFLFSLQLCLALLACIGWFSPIRGRLTRFCRVVTSFYLMNLAIAAGFIDWMRASKKVTWEPTPRPDVSCNPLLQPEVYR